jgi:exodeoxyribonuclease III
MIAATWNVNSIRARMPHLIRWLAESQPDLVALQETKVEDAKFPFADLEPTGYHVSIHGQKSYNGVCILSKEPLDEVAFGYLPDWPTDCRVARCVYKGVPIINTYVPNGTQVGSEKWGYKLRWLDAFPEYLASLGSSADDLLWMGDINVAPTPDDVFESAKHLGGVGHHPDEFRLLGKIVDWGLTDCFRMFTEGPGHYTYWDFRLGSRTIERNLGWRIDHIYTSEKLKSRVKRCWIEKDPRSWERPSDHCPVLVELD